VKEEPATEKNDIFFAEKDQFIENIKKKSRKPHELWAIGEVDMGIDMLKRKIGLQSTKPLQKIITDFSVFGQFYYSTGLPNGAVFTQNLTKDQNSIYSKYSFQAFRKKFENILNLVTKAKFSDAIELIKEVNVLSSVTVVENLANAEALQSIKQKLLNYSIVLRAKQAAEKESDPVKKVRLLLVASCVPIEPVHQLLMLQFSINQLIKLGNYLHALLLTRKYLQLALENKNLTKEENVQKIKRMEAACDKNGKNQHAFAFKEKYLYEASIVDRIDFSELTFYFPEDVQDSQLVRCPFDGSTYSADKKGQICPFNDMSEIGYDEVQYSVVEDFKRTNQ